MNLIELKTGGELHQLILKTENALKKLSTYTPDKPEDEKIFDDGMYYLSFSEHRDGSGNKVDLSRYSGNAKLIIVIRTELERQLEEFKDMLKKL